MLSNPAAFFGAILPKKPRVFTMFAQREGHTDDLVCKWGGAAPPPTPPLFKGHGCLQKKTRVRSSPPSMLAPKNKHQVVAVWFIHVCTRGKLRGSFCLQMGGAAPPPDPPLFKNHGCLPEKKGVRSSPPSMFAKNRHQVVSVWIIHFCTRGKLRGSFCLQMGWAAPPPTPPLFKGHGCLQKKTRVRSSPPSMFAPKNKHQVVAMWIIHVCTMGKLRGSFGLHMGWAAPPPTPPLFKGHGCLRKKTRVRSSPASMFAPKKKHQVVAMWIIHVCTRGKLRGSFCLQMGGAAPPPAPPLFKNHGCLPKKRESGRRHHRCLQKKQASGRFRVDHSFLH